MHHRHAVSEKRMCLGNILAPRAVACDSLHLRASAHLWHVSAFLCNREFPGISCYIKKLRKTWASSLRSSGALHTDHKPGRYFPYEL